MIISEGYPMYWRQVKPKGQQFSALDGDLNRFLTRARYVIEALIGDMYDKPKFMKKKHNFCI